RCAEPLDDLAREQGRITGDEPALASPVRVLEPGPADSSAMLDMPEKVGPRGHRLRHSPGRGRDPAVIGNLRRVGIERVRVTRRTELPPAVVLPAVVAGGR